MSSYRRTSAPPCRWNRTAFIWIYDLRSLIYERRKSSIVNRKSQMRSLSKCVGGKDDRFAQIEEREIAADDVEVADDKRREARGIEVLRQYARGLARRDALHNRDKLCKVVVGQVVQRELRR